MPSKFMEKPSVFYKTAVAGLKKLLVTEGLEAVQAAYAESSHEEHRTEWQKYRGLKQGAFVQPSADYLLWEQPKGDRLLIVPHQDHASVWSKDGKPYILVSQPYDLELDDLREMVKLCDRHGFEVDITTHPGWHFPGQVLHVEYTRADDEKAE